MGRFVSDVCQRRNRANEQSAIRGQLDRRYPGGRKRTTERPAFERLQFNGTESDDFYHPKRSHDNDRRQRRGDMEYHRRQQC